MTRSTSEDGTSPAGRPGLVLVVALTAAGAGVYDAVAEHDGIAGLDQPALDQAIAPRSATKTIARYGRVDLLCIDELGYMELNRRGAELCSRS